MNRLSARPLATLFLLLWCACSGTVGKGVAHDTVRDRRAAADAVVPDTLDPEPADLVSPSERRSLPDSADSTPDKADEVDEPACDHCGDPLAPCPIGSIYADLGPPGDEYTDLSAAIYYPACEEGQETAVAPGPFPVVVFGHGYQQSYGDYRYVWEALVPRGYIVTLPDKLSKATTVDINEYAADLAHMADTLQLWGQDKDSTFFEKVAPAVAVMGHSTGSGAGIDAVATGLFEETPPVTIVSLAPLGNIDSIPINGLSPIEAAADVQVPTLIMQGKWDCICPPDMNAIPIFEALPEETIKHLVKLPDGDHCGFSDQQGPGLELCETAEFGFCFLVFGDLDNRGDTLGSELQNPLTISLALPWLDHWVKQTPKAWDQFEEALEQPEFVYD